MGVGGVKQHPRTGDLALLHVRVPARVARALREEAARQELSVSLCAASLLVRGLGLAPEGAPEKSVEQAGPALRSGRGPGAPAPYRCEKCGSGYETCVPRCDECGNWNTVKQRAQPAGT